MGCLRWVRNFKNEKIAPLEQMCRQRKPTPWSKSPPGYDFDMQSPTTTKHDAQFSSCPNSYSPPESSGDDGWSAPNATVQHVMHKGRRPWRWAEGRLGGTKQQINMLKTNHQKGTKTSKGGRTKFGWAKATNQHRTRHLLSP